MARDGFKNVTRKRPCLVCGKPDWCSYKEDESVSYCARVREGADRLTAKEGRGVFYHNKTFAPPVKSGFSRFRKSKTETEIPFAPLEIRDFIYQTLLRLSPAGVSSILTTGAKGLAERGLTNFDDYGSLPAAQADRRNLANELRLLLNRTFPDYLRENSYGLRSVPGFWLDERGEANLWLDKDYKNPLLLVPYRTPTGKIQACQLRAMGAEKMSAPSTASRYYWLSVPKRGSAGCGTPLHYANWRDFSALSRFRAVLVTEGALKADAVKIHLSDFYVVANSGVNCAHEIIINIARGKPVFVAFDKDYHENPAVVRQLARLLKMRLDDNRTWQNFTPTKILTWSGAEKGIDDALLNNNRLTELSALDWFQTLPPPARAEAEKVWEI
jgi:hypothetical protein